MEGVWYYCTCMEEYMDEEGELTPPGRIDFSRVEMEGRQKLRGCGTTVPVWRSMWMRSES